MKHNFRVNMKSKFKKAIKDLKAGRFGQSIQLSLSYCFDHNPAVMDCRRAGMCIHIS